MWLLDFPEHDPDSNYPEPLAKQLLYAEEARRELANLKGTLHRLTVPQQRAILSQIREELVDGVFQRTPIRTLTFGTRHCAERSRRCVGSNVILRGQNWGTAAQH
jgi:hypothetical protein